MDIEQRLRASLVAPDPGPAFTERVLARLGRGAARRRTGFTLLGTVLALAAAAAALKWRAPDPQVPPQVVAAEAATPEPVVVVAAPMPLPEPPAASPMSPAAPDAAAPRAMASHVTVRVLPLPEELQPLAGGAAPGALRAALIDELRLVPGLVVQDQEDQPERAINSRADFVLRFAPVSDARVRTVTAIGTNRNLAAAGDPQDTPRIEMIVQARDAAVHHFPLTAAVEGALPTGCNEADGSLREECQTPALIAADQVMLLRLQVFPPDTAYFQQVVEQLHHIDMGTCNACMNFTAGERRVMKLVERLAFDGGSRLDAGTIRALARYIAAQSARRRANLWSTLRWAGVSHPALAVPLVETLRNDPDQQVRLIALAHLEKEFGADPAVHRALDLIGREDPDALVSGTARRALHGEARWREEILAALLDTSQPYAARLAPLVANGLAVTPAQQAQRRAVLQEPQVLQPLIALIREHGMDGTQAPITRSVLEPLASIDDPAVFELFLQLVRDGRLAQETTVHEAVVQGNTIQPHRIDLSGPVSSWVIRHRDDPRLLLLSGGDPQLRALLGHGRPASTHPEPVDLSVIPDALIERMQELAPP